MKQNIKIAKQLMKISNQIFSDKYKEILNNQERITLAKQLFKVSNELQKFTGSEANLYK